jgi:hypothetical protein
VHVNGGGRFGSLQFGCGLAQGRVYLGHGCIGRRPVCLCGFECACVCVCVRVCLCCAVMLRILIPFSSS